ncbi:probable helicase senataxin [Crotalus tigris]|uniref:probable helicase senataxin n=1 Tax=Crotalus tigris TaxID=88082 RepID=UPI00192FB271|nr:probable helicase senataxin [Crotalus tigris]XP_039178859.1 probable helicase senataxin [Crotalus tigris]
MSTCCWCTPGGLTTIKLLTSYASSALSPKDVAAANEDLCYCLECVEEYHKARDEVPSLHQILWDREVSRLVDRFEKSMQEDNENDLYLVEEDRITPLISCYTGPNFEKRLRVPLLEVLKYPYLLLHEHLSELCVDALCKMEEMNYSYQVVGKHPGIYLLMVHPNEMIRRWAILTARNLGKVDRDDYYDIQEVMICLFKVVELGLFENPDIYSSPGIEKTKLILLPPHLYDTSNYKNYWLGLCMLLSVLEEQAMDSMLLGPDKQNFMQSIMNTMKKQTDDEINDPFWPVLHCFMVILDKLGSKVWGQLVDPVQAFQAIINNASYKKEIENIRRNCSRTKSEPLLDYRDETVTCSQIVYNYNLERPHKDSRLKTTACLDYCPNFYEEMQTLTDMFQYDIGRDMRLHHSTFLWFIPFVHSLMDLKGLGVAYSMVVIQHLCSEVKEVLHHTVQPCDKVSQFFIWILVMVVELNLKKKCFNTLWVSSQNWVEVVVTCARLPSMAFACRAEKDFARNGPRSLTKVPSWEPDSIQSACMNLIRLLLKEGYQMGQKASPFLDELNLLRRSHEDWKLSPQQARELQTCLIEIIRSLWTKSSSPSSHGASPTRLFSEQEGRSPGYLPQEHSTYQSPRRQDEVFQEGTLSEKKYSLEEEAKRSICGKQSHQRSSEFHLANIKQELKESLLHEDHMLHSTGSPTDAQNSGSSHSRLMKQNSSLNQGSFDKVVQKKDTSGKEEKPRIIDVDLHQWPSSSALEEKQIPKKFTEKMKSNKADLTLKLKQFVQNRKRQLGPESEKQQSIKEEKQDQEEMTRRTSGDGSCMSNWALSLENGFQAKTLCIKKEPRDSLAEFKSAWKSGAESEESSTDDELNVPLLEIRKELIRKKSMVQAMEPEIDKKGKLCLVAGRESTLSYQNPIQRKVQGALRSLSESESHTLSSEAGRPSNQVIIISDLSSDEEENKVNLSQRSQEENLSVSLQKDPEANEQDAITVSSSPLMYGECESQCFEFETEEEIYSAWQDSQLDKTTEADVFPVKTADRSASSDLELARHLDEQDYDTDHLGHDIIEKNEQELEQQVKIDKTKLKLPVQADEKNVGEGSTAVGSKYFTAMHADGRETPKQSSASTSSTPLLPPPSGRPLTPSLEPTPRPRKSLAKSKWLNTAQRSPEKRRLVTEKSPCATPSGSPHPFVVPPKKVHHFPEPTSTVEKLGLKKRARRAAELSQRSHDVVAQLRSYGKAAGQLPQKRRRAKLIEPQRMVIRNKVLLASQERQFFRQSRPKKKEKGDNVPRAKRTFLKPTVASTSKEEVENLKGKPSQFSHSSNHVKELLPQHSQGDDGSHSAPLEREALPSSRQDPLKPDSDVPGCSTAVPGSVCSSSEVGSSSSDSSSDQRSKNLSENASGLKEDLNPEENEDDLFLTQRDPVDMELCSQMDSSSHPEDTVVLPTLQDPPQVIENCRHPGCPKKMEGAGPFCHGHSLPNPPDHVFAKPCAPPKPSTKKIFSSSAASQIASLSKDLETSSTHVAAAKTSKADGLRTKLTLANLLCPSNMNNVSTQPQNSHVVGNASKMPVPRSDTGQEARPFFARVNSSHNQPRDHSIFTKEILKWSYDMFANFRELGPPSHLLQALVISVPVKFPNYDDYFKIFFPLMMLNAFEEVAFDWMENRKLKEPKSFHLTLLNFNMDLNKADFTANISQHDVENKYHPKDDDLVLLTVSDKRFYDEREGENRAIQHVGFVTRFSNPCIHNAKTKEQQVTCHLSIQTQGNLSRIEKEVKCIVVSSLATTHRRFQALLMLNRSPLAMPILSPSAPYFSPRDLNAESEKSLPYMRDFNQGQRRAIESAYAMITQHPSSPKICLIHGPPGTGKSKVIVGLLHRILDERSGKENAVQRLNAKIKTNRILVCAPSNAAIDNLMKKIILEFKKYREKNALGNCGDINLVRLGQQKSINSEVRKFSLDDQVDRKINKAMLGKHQDLQKRKEDLDRQLDTLSRLRAMDRSENGEKKQQLEDEICQLSKERQCLASQLKEARGRSQELKASIILESHIICCTLSTSGGMLLKSAFRRLGGDPVSCVIVDEAGQTCEIETLIPLIHGCKKLVLVGDPEQLPPTIKSLKAQDHSYDQSLIDRLCKHLKEQDQENISGKFPVFQLTVQYRMHPEICLFPSKYIYEGVLTTDRKIAEDRFSLAWPFQPYLLFDVLDSREECENDSFYNPQELTLLTELMKVIKEKKKDIGSRQIGIITPYNAQKRRIQRQLDKEFGENNVGEIDTVDGFQGREKDCVIVTCVRANSTQGSIGFLRSLKRLNVIITRAKYSLFILGKLKTLMENKDWNEMIQDAQRRGNIIQTSKNTYRTSALKILKSRPFPCSRVATPERDAQEPSAFSGTKQQALPGPDTQRPPVPLPTPAVNRTPQETQKPRPLLVRQPKPIQDRPQDPRLFRRAKSASKAANGKEGETSALWASSRQKNPGPLPAQSRSNSADTLGETSSRVGAPLPSRAPSTEIPDQRLSFLTEQFKTSENVPGYPQRILEASQEKDDSTQPKKRRITF